MLWNTLDQEEVFFRPQAPCKNLSKQNSTMLSTNVILEEEEDLKKLLINSNTVQEDNLHFFSETNSLFEVQNEDLNLFDRSVKEEEEEEVPNNSPLSDTDSTVTAKVQSLSLPAKKRKKAQKSSQCCKCKNSNCLRLHCSCFKELGHCGPSCRCRNCLNTKDF